MKILKLNGPVSDRTNGFQSISDELDAYLVAEPIGELGLLAWWQVRFMCRGVRALTHTSSGSGPSIEVSNTFSSCYGLPPYSGFSSAL